MPEHGSGLTGGLVDGIPAVVVAIRSGEDDDAELHTSSLKGLVVSG
jgi:hypothetical protein